MNPDDRSSTDPTTELLARALSDEASQVQTDPGALQRIQQRTAGTAKHSQRRRWMWAAGGAGLATAALVTGIVLVVDGGDDRGGAPAVKQPTQQGPTTPTVPTSVSVPMAMHQGVYDPNPDAGSRNVDLVYLVPPTAMGSVRLTVEPHTAQAPDAEFQTVAVHEFLTSRPIDQDYRSGWPAGVDIESLTRDRSTVTIALVGDADISDPGGLTPDEAEMAIQALLFTAASDSGGVFTYNGQPVTTLLGVDVSKPVQPLSAAEVRSFISIDNVVERQTLTAPVNVQVSGNVYEGNMNWTLYDANDTVVDQGFVTTAQGEWRRAVIRLGDLAPGDYRLECADLSGKGGSVFFADTKGFTVS